MVEVKTMNNFIQPTVKKTGNKFWEALKAKYSKPAIPVNDRRMIKLLEDRIYQIQVGQNSEKKFMEAFDTLGKSLFSYFGETPDDFKPE